MFPGWAEFRELAPLLINNQEVLVLRRVALCVCESDRTEALIWLLWVYIWFIYLTSNMFFVR